MTTCGDQDSGKKQLIVTKHSDIYWEDENWHCPLCDSIVTNIDRSNIRPELYLQEWHDTFLDENYFDEKICNISDEELFAAIDLSQPNLKSLKNLVGKEMFDTAALEFGRIYRTKSDEFRMYSYPEFPDKPFITLNQFLSDAEKPSEKKNEIIKRAREASDPQKGFTIAGVLFGDEIDFNRDVKPGWKYGAVNFSYGRDLLYAYMLTNDSYYLQSLETIFNQLYDYRDKMSMESKYNPLWNELGLAGRVRSLIDMYRLVGLQLSAETQKNCLKFILGQTRWLYEALVQNPFHSYNWQTANATSVGYAALVFPEFKESKQWLEASEKYMRMHFEQTLLEDGGHIERSVSYANYVFSMFYRYILMMDYFKGDKSWDEQYMVKLERLTEFTMLTHSPLGTSCPFNDARRDKDKFVDYFMEMADFFHRGDFLTPVLLHVPSRQLENLSVKPRIPSALSLNFPQSEYAVMRSSWNSDAYFFIMNYGPFRNHAHVDALDFELYANGVPIAVDAGIGAGAYEDPIHVSWYKHPNSHNMVVVNDAFLNKRKAGGKDVTWISQHKTDYFAATHEGYKAINGAVQRRHVAFIKNRYWIIFDQTWADQPDLPLTWNLHSPLHFNKIPNGFESRERVGAVLLSAGDSLATTEIRQGMANLTGFSAEPDHREIDWLIFKKQTSAEPAKNEFAVLVLPKTEDGELPLFKKINTPDEEVRFYKLNTNGAEEWIIFSDGKNHTYNHLIEGDFRFGWFKILDGKIKAVSVGDLTRLNITDVMSLTLSQRNNYENEF